MCNCRLARLRVVSRIETRDATRLLPDVSKISIAADRTCVAAPVVPVDLLDSSHLPAGSKGKASSGKHPARVIAGQPSSLPLQLVRRRVPSRLQRAC